MKIVIDEVVLLFLKENKIHIKSKLKKIGLLLMRYPEMYEPIEKGSVIRHFFIDCVEFAYYIGKDTIYISDVRFKKSNVRFKVDK